MKRNAFTMIELIFVIVILGILASVAIPKLAGVQDDALVSTEDAGIAAARSSIQAVHGTAILRGANDFNTTVSTAEGRSAKLLMQQPIPVATTTLSAARYPVSLSLVDDTTGVAEGAAVTVNAAASTNNANTLGVVLDAGNRDSWKTAAPNAALPFNIAGPATSSLTAGNTDAQYNTTMSWAYNPNSGTITLDTATASTSF